MLSLNVIKYYSKINKELEKIDKLMNFVDNNSLVYERNIVLEKIMGSTISGNTTTFNYSVKRTNTESEKMVDSLKKGFESFRKGFDMLSFFGTINEIKNNFQNYNNEFGYTDENIVSLLNDLYVLSQKYQIAIQNGQYKDIVDFLSSINPISKNYFSVRRGIDCFINAIGNESYNPNYDYTKSLEFRILDSDFNVGEFGEILVLLDNSYNSIKTLLKKDKIIDLKIIKIESGSFLSLLFGNDSIIELLVLIIKTMAKEMYQKCFLTGKIQKQSEIIQTISKSADIIEKFDKIGINTGKSKSDLKDCLNITTNNIYKILSRSGKIVINDELISVNDNKLLEYKTKLIETKEESK